MQFPFGLYFGWFREWLIWNFPERVDRGQWGISRVDVGYVESGRYRSQDCRSNL